MSAAPNRWLLCLAALGALAAGCCGRGLNVHLKHSVDFQRPAQVSLRAPKGEVVGLPVEGRGCRSGEPKVAIIPIDGPMLNKTRGTGLGDNPVGLFREQLDAVAATPGVCVLVLRINSAGGSVTATEIMAGELRRFKARTGLPVIACLMDVGTGGAYYLAAEADLVTAYPTTVTGGIGVVLNLYNMQEAMATANVLGQSIKSGENIDMGSDTHALSEDAQLMLQAMADDFRLRFIEAVRRARPALASAPETAFDGRVMTGGQAVELGFVDRLSTLPEVLDTARQTVGRPEAPAYLFVRREEQLRSIYGTPYGNLAIGEINPLSIPGLKRSELPLFLYMWQPNPLAE